MSGSNRGVRVLLGGGLGFLGFLLAPASALAIPTVTSANLTVPSSLNRGATTAATATVDASESATFNLAVSAAAPGGVTVSYPGTCSTNIGALCTVMADGSVTVFTDGDVAAEESLTATITVNLQPSATIALPSTEGATPPSAGRTINTSVTPTGGTVESGGADLTDSDATSVRSNPTTDAEIRLQTTAPLSAPTLLAPAGSSVSYTATLNRFGLTAQQTNVSLALVADSAQGTTVSGSPTTVMFSSGATSATRSIVVDVPAGTAVGATPAYHFVATYDPTATNGTPLDTETGSTRSFQVTVASTLPPVLPPAPVPTANTGLRAAALKKCKRKKGKQARKRCKKHALKLPV
jgi:hypothetical protein